MSTSGRVLPRSRWQGLCCAVLLLCLAPPLMGAETIELREAQRVTASGSVQVALPDTLLAADGAMPPLRATYRLPVSLPEPPARLALMFNALLDVSRMDAGAVIPRPRPFPPAPMLHRLAQELAAQAADKGLRLCRH